MEGEQKKLQLKLNQIENKSLQQWHHNKRNQGGGMGKGVNKQRQDLQGTDVLG